MIRYRNSALRFALRLAATVAVAGGAMSFFPAAADDHDIGRFEPKIIGGTPALKQTETVRILYDDLSGTARLCTGVLVANDKVLTAGHCTCGQANSYRVEFWPADEAATSPTVLRTNQAPIRFNQFSCNLALERQAGRDLGLLRLDTSELAANVLPKPLPVETLYRLFEAKVKQLQVVGYGRTEDGTLPTTRREVDVNIRSYFCSRGSVADSRCAMFREFVLSNASRSPVRPLGDSCAGDSGGPVIWVNPKNDERALIGITSRALLGVNHLRGTLCGGGGLYTAVAHAQVRSWLQDSGVKVTLAQ